MLDKVNLRKHGQLNDLNNGYCLYRLIDLCLLFILDTIRDDLKEGTSDCRKKMVNLAQETLALATGLFEWFHYNWKQRSRGSGFE